MKKFKETGRRISSMLLILLMCVALLPAGVFAEGEVDVQGNDPAAAEVQAQDQDQDIDSPADAEEDSEDAEEPVVMDIESDQEQAVEDELVEEAAPEEPLDAEGDTPDDVTPEPEPEPEPEPVPVVPAGLIPAKKSVSLNKVNVQFATDIVPDKNSNLRPSRVWLKGQNGSMRVNWVNAKNLEPVYGVIILRSEGTANNRVFKEIKRIGFRKKLSNNEIEINPKTAYTDTTAKKNNTAYTYRVASYYWKDGYYYVSPVSDWACGQTAGSKLKNVYTATINKKSATLQSGKTVTLKLTVASPKTKFKPTSRRWTTSNKNVATVTAKGVVTAKAPGTAVIYGTLASGYRYSCKVTVRGAFTPGTPTLKVDYATTNSIMLIWNKAKYATSYDVYKSNDGLHWDKPIRTKNTQYQFKGLQKNHRYTFYVIARNDNKGLDASGKAKVYSVVGKNSNVLNQKAVVKLRPTSVTGFPTSKSMKAGGTYKISVKVAFPEGRKASLQMKSGKKWITKKTITLPKGSGTSKVNITFPSAWWDGKTQWRLVIPKNKTAAAFTTKTLTITAQRRYQNPSSYVQIKNSISKHGYSHYVSPVLVNSASTKSDHIEALIKTANKYKGCRYAQSRSGAPGNGIDESGLIMQACYGAGVDLWPISPSTRPYNCIPGIMNSKLRKITYKPAAEGSNDYTTMWRGDLIFFGDSDSKNTPIHAAIYTGSGSIIHADPIKGNVNVSTIRKMEDPDGPYKYHVVGVRRIFN